MISGENYRKVHIRITTYKEGNLQRSTKKQDFSNMNEERNKNGNKFICSICLNSKRYERNNENSKKIPTSPVQKICYVCSENQKVQSKEIKIHVNKKVFLTKSVQTSQTDLNKSLNLLNEVLTVFQNKKQMEARDKSKTVILKDANISTDDVRTILLPKLSVSKVFSFAIDDTNMDKNNKFTIVTSHEDIVRSRYSIDLPKHKSSSIPQMKLEELKNSVKQKTRSKDALEEVNRMFATVKKSTNLDPNDSNRPLVRNGPRILPFVKTYDGGNVNQSESDEKLNEKYACPCVQVSNCMSSGDSFVKPEYCHKHLNYNEKCDKCVYMMCCHYKNCRKMKKAGVMICDRCCQEERKFHCKHEREKNFGDSY